MFKFLLRRIVALIPVAIFISILLFTIFKMMPGDPIDYMIPPGSIQDPEIYALLVANARAKLGLDQPVLLQYFLWVRNMLIGDFGYSSLFQLPVGEVLSEPLFNTIIINVFSITIAFLISIPVGIISAVKKDSIHDRSWQVFSIVGLSMPTFFVGLTLIFVFALTLGWFPAGGMPFRNPGTPEFYISYLQYMVLPIVTLTIGALAGTIRYVRGSMIDALSKDYIRTARSKGLSEKIVIYSHAFRNALIPVVTILAFSIVGLFGGSAITERIFVWNGIGSVLINALTVRDYNLVLIMNMFYAVLSLMANILMDIGYAIVDPRVKVN
jgi:peptide/nickel transport system permease protein